MASFAGIFSGILPNDTRSRALKVCLCDACVVCLCGVLVWCACVVCLCGVFVWCACVVCLCGILCGELVW